MTWLNEDSISSRTIDESVGFIYKVTSKKDKKFYYGIKKFKKRIRRKPLKGKKRVRIDAVGS